MRDNHIPTTEPENGKRKVMIVDDDEQIVDLFVDMLTRDGRFEVKVARTGYDAGVLAEQFKPDLMILDSCCPISTSMSSAGACGKTRRGQQ